MVVTRSPKPAVPQSAPPVIKLRKANEGAPKGVTGIVYSAPGIGKTSLLRTIAPHYSISDVLFINIDAGDTVVSDLDISTLDIGPTTDLRALKLLYHKIVSGEILADKTNRLVFIDSLSEEETYMRNAITSNRGKAFPTIKEYGDSAIKLREYSRLYRGLRDIGIDVIYCALEQDMDIQNDTNGVVTKCVPMVSKRMVVDMMGMVDFVAHMEKDDRTEQRWLRMQSNDRFSAKTRFPWLDKFEPPSLSELMAKIKEGGSYKLPSEMDPEGERVERNVEAMK